MATQDNIISGSFVSDGTAKTLSIRCDLDHMEVLNYTQMATQQATGRGVKFEWYRGMAADAGVEYKKTNSTDVMNGVTLSSGGFTLVDSSVSTLAAPLTITAVSQANPAVVSLAATTGLTNGDVVRIYGTTGMRQIAGMDFTIAALTANTSFTLAYLNSSGFGAAASAGTIRRVPYEPIYYPRARYITAITAASSAVITMSVTHGMTVGQRVTFVVPAAFGMTQMDSLDAQITAINTTTNTITVNIDSSAFTAFAFPTSASVPFTFAQVIPFGDAPLTVANPGGDQSVLDGATRNTAILGMRLAGGAQSPAGSSGDVIYWKAFKSSQVQS